MVDREFRTSRRALNVLSVRVRTVRAGDQILKPSERRDSVYPAPRDDEIEKEQPWQASRKH